MAQTSLTTSTTLVEWLDDLSVRFLLNLPASELSSVPRLCFQVEEAQWFYEDFVRPAVAASGAPPLPSLHLRTFCLLLFQHCPLLSGFTSAQHLAAYEEFLAYKVRVPVRGAIMLDDSMEHVLLVRGWKKGATWSFPRGKINKDEPDLDCAVREVWEETGYDIRGAGLVPGDESQAKYIDITMREQHMRLFVFRGVPFDTHFEPRTRKEIGKIQWYPIKDLPGFKRTKTAQGQTHQSDLVSGSKFYMVAPFLGPLRKWINQQRRDQTTRMQMSTIAPGSQQQHGAAAGCLDAEEGYQTPGPEYSAEDRSQELRTLLNMGADPAHQQQAAPAMAPQSTDLLAILNGSRPQHTINTPVNQEDLLVPPIPAPLPRHSEVQQALKTRQAPESSLQPYSPGQQFAGASPHFQSFPQTHHATHSIQGSQGVIAGAQVAPKASELPAPTLNPHSTALLNAFKGNTARKQHAQPSSYPRSSTVHQTALLGLFNTGRKHDESSRRSPPEDGNVQETRPDERPPAPRRQSTLNEITRTLPSRAKSALQTASNADARTTSSSTTANPTVLSILRRQDAPSPPQPSAHHNEQPQVLKRADANIPSAGHGQGHPSALDKQNHLLSLFGKTEKPASQTVRVANDDNSKTSLTALFEPQSANKHSSRVLQTNNNATAPRTSSVQQTSVPTYNPLLDLFAKPAPSEARSPEPAVGALYSVDAVEDGPEQRPRLTSVTSQSSVGGKETPQEAKNFLLGYLNGLVQNEGKV